ncbi:MAG: radical SAM family heme chaperone HemW [Bacilli bacterium]|nr:radical SAM family heme chaperone HemW [Bacilli bacterium]
MHSVYIHIPFCNNICSYCAFTKFYYNEERVKKYLDALKNEIETNYKGEVIKTLYIGGGTPSCLNISELKYLFDIIKIFNLDEIYEFTIEVNPENIDKEKILLFKKNKVNRISMGVETTNNNFLKYLGRKYDYNLVKEKIKLIKYIGFKNINVDLIYALPNETFNDLEKDINKLLELDVSHISTYSLMIEPHTRFYIDKEKEIEEDIDWEMYKLICSKLKENGYKHYEVSNFSKIGYESCHNLVYWNNEHYYGFGLGASGYIENIRYTNTTSMKQYLEHNYKEELEYLSNKDIISYELILGFRKIEGINKQDFYNKYNIDIKSLYNIKELLENGNLKENSSHIFINYDKIYIENQILMNFVGEENEKV